MALEYEIKANGIGFDALERELKGFAGTADQFAKKLRSLGVELAKGGQGDYVIEYKTAGAYRALQGLTRALQGNTKAEARREAELARAMKTEKGSLMQRRQMLSQAKQDLSFMARGSTAYDTLSAKVEEYTEALRRANGVMPNSQEDIAAIGKSLQDQASKLTLAEQKNRGLTKAIEQNARALSRAKGIQQGSIKDLQRLRENAQSLANTLKIGSKAQIAAANAVKVYDTRLNKASGKTLNFISVLGKLSTIQSGLLAISSAFGSVAGAINQVVNRTKSVESFNLALQNVGLSSVETARTFDTAAASAFKLGAPVEQVEKAFKRIVPALRAIGTSSNDTNKFIEALTARTQVLGLSTEASGRLQEAFAQVLAKGKLQAEELTQQISEVDGAFRTQFAQALGVSIEKLGELVEQGQITSDVFVKTFLNMENGAEALSQKVALGGATIQQLQNNLKNVQTKTLEALGEALEPAIRSILELSTAFAKFVQESLKSDFGKTLTTAFNSIVKTIEILGKAFIAVAGFIGTLLAPLGPLLNLIAKLAGPILAVAAAFTTLNLVTVIYRKSIAALNIQVAAGSKAAGLLRRSLVNLKGIFTELIKGNLANSFKNLQLTLINLGKAAGKSLFGDAPKQLLDFGKKALDTRKKNLLLQKTLNFAAPKAKYGAVAKGIGSIGAKSVVAKGAVAALGVASGLAFGALAAGVLVGAKFISSYDEALRKMQGPIKESKNNLESLGFQVEKTSGRFDGLKNVLKALLIVPFVIDGFKELGAAIDRGAKAAAFSDAMGQLNKQIEAVGQTLADQGVTGFRDFANASKLSQKELNRNIQGLRGVSKATLALAAEKQKELGALKSTDAGYEANSKQLKQQIAALEEKGAALELTARGLDTVTGKNEAAANKELSLKDNLLASNKALADKKAQLEQIAGVIATEGQDKLNQGLITEKQLLLETAAVRQQIAQKNAAALESEIAANNQRRAQSASDALALQDRALELRDQQIKANAEIKASEAELRQAQIARIQEVKAENDSLIASYNQLKGIQSSAVGDLSTGIKSALDSFMSSVKQAAKVNFIVTGDVRFLQDALRVEGEVFAMNAKIEQIKQRIAFEEKQHKLEMIALEAEAQKAMLTAKGVSGSDPRIAVLDKIVNKTRTLQGINEQMNGIQEKTLNFQLSQQQKNINLRRQAAGMPPIKVVDEVSLRDATSFYRTEIPKAAKSFEAVATGTIKANGEIVRLGQAGIQNIKDAANEGKGAVDKASSGVKDTIAELGSQETKIKTNLFGLDPAVVQKQLGKTEAIFNSTTAQITSNLVKMNGQFSNSSTAIKQLGADATSSLGEVNKAVKAVGDLQSRMQGLPTINRAMGGPVSGGQTYKVNDGGGRESFVDNTGKVTLLPAARNMKWTAPKSGYVLNADDTKAMINNNKINASITAATKVSRPAKHSESVSGIVSPGTLMKQMGSIMKGGDTQRITNNVTIQSQAPVMDASKLLTDINIMRARRGRRL